jgi:hypothetical protein
MQIKLKSDNILFLPWICGATKKSLGGGEGVGGA